MFPPTPTNHKHQYPILYPAFWMMALSTITYHNPSERTQTTNSPLWSGWAATSAWYQSESFQSAMAPTSAGPPGIGGRLGPTSPWTSWASPADESSGAWGGVRSSRRMRRMEVETGPFWMTMFRIFLIGFPHTYSVFQSVSSSNYMEYCHGTLPQKRDSPAAPRLAPQH